MSHTIINSTFDNCITASYTIDKSSTEVIENFGGTIHMQYILSLLPVLACPVGMGLMIWLMMRQGKEQMPPDAAPQQEDRPVASPRASPVAPTPMSSQHTSPLKAIWDCVQMCLNWRVLVGLAVVGLAVWVVAPRLVLAALPLLLVVACPLSMLVMMGRMRGGQPAQANQLPAEGRTRDEQVAELRSRFLSMPAEQEAIARQIAEIESPETPVMSEAEAVARGADERSWTIRER